MQWRYFTSRSQRYVAVSDLTSLITTFVLRCCPGTGLKQYLKHSLRWDGLWLEFHANWNGFVGRLINGWPIQLAVLTTSLCCWWACQKARLTTTTYLPTYLPTSRSHTDALPNSTRLQPAKGASFLAAVFPSESPHRSYAEMLKKTA